jgi:cell division transport system ATP-binding protein
LIELIGVTRKYGAITALHNANLHIRPGEFVLLSGPSGAGKTTLLRTLFAAVRPDEGRVVVDGKDITRVPRRAVPALRRSVGVVFQDFKLLGQRSALANVAIALEIRGLPPAQIHSRSQLALAAVGLEARAATPVSLLSGGEQQRVAIARALVGSPSLLLADEPTGNLDPERSHDILDLLALEAGRGTTIVVATHDPMVVQNAAAHRVVLMDSGRIIGTLSGANAPVDLPRRARPRPSPGVLKPVPACEVTG